MESSHNKNRSSIVRVKKSEKTGQPADEKPIGRPPAQPQAKRARAADIAEDIITGDILSNEKLRRRYPLVLWCVFLVFLYIGIHFNYQRMQRLEIQQRILLNEERSRAVIFSSMRMNASRHSRIVEEIKRRGIPLEESTVPPKIIEK